MAKILVVGCGVIGQKLAIQLTHAGHTVTGLKRNPPLNPENIYYHRADITLAASLDSLPGDFDHVFFIVSADGRNDSSYQNIYQTGIDNLHCHFAKIGCRAPWFFVSSTSVYGQNQGEWVDETSLTLPDKSTSRQIVAAEQKLLADNSHNVIVRFSGIYGPGREYLLRMARQTPVIQQTPPYYTNRIHQDDCVGVLAFLLEQRLQGVKLDQCYLASDNDPAPLWDVISWMTFQMRVDQPTAKATEADIDMNKRCRNDRLKKLGFNFRYPDYKAGYIELINNTYDNKLSAAKS